MCLTLQLQQISEHILILNLLSNFLLLRDLAFPSITAVLFCPDCLLSATPQFLFPLSVGLSVTNFLMSFKIIKRKPQRTKISPLLLFHYFLCSLNLQIHQSLLFDGIKHPIPPSPYSRFHLSSSSNKITGNGAIGLEWKLRALSNYKWSKKEGRCFASSLVVFFFAFGFFFFSFSNNLPRADI